MDQQVGVTVDVKAPLRDISKALKPNQPECLGLTLSAFRQIRNNSTTDLLLGIVGRYDTI